MWDAHAHHLTMDVAKSPGRGRGGELRDGLDPQGRRLTGYRKLEYEGLIPY